MKRVRVFPFTISRWLWCVIAAHCIHQFIMDWQMTMMTQWILVLRGFNPFSFVWICLNCCVSDIRELISKQRRNWISTKTWNRIKFVVYFKMDINQTKGCHLLNSTCLLSSILIWRSVWRSVKKCEEAFCRSFVANKN